MHKQFAVKIISIYLLGPHKNTPWESPGNSRNTYLVDRQNTTGIVEQGKV